MGSEHVAGNMTCSLARDNAAGSAYSRPSPNADNVHYVKLVIERPFPTVPEGAVLSQ